VGDEDTRGDRCWVLGQWNPHTRIQQCCTDLEPHILLVGPYNSYHFVAFPSFVCVLPIKLVAGNYLIIFYLHILPLKCLLPSSAQPHELTLICSTGVTLLPSLGHPHELILICSAGVTLLPSLGHPHELTLICSAVVTLLPSHQRCLTLRIA
jgi:hypothetical protein